jgi:hypothetical protein
MKPDIQYTDRPVFALSAQRMAPPQAATEGDETVPLDPPADLRRALSFSSEAPVRRAAFVNGEPCMINEILSHAPGAVDLSKLNDGANLLFNHCPDEYLGVIESA